MSIPTINSKTIKNLLEEKGCLNPSDIVEGFYIFSPLYLESPSFIEVLTYVKDKDGQSKGKTFTLKIV